MQAIYLWTMYRLSKFWFILSQCTWASSGLSLILSFIRMGFGSKRILNLNLWRILAKVTVISKNFHHFLKIRFDGLKLYIVTVFCSSDHHN